MFTGIDHLVIAVADPDAAVEALAATLGLSPGGGGRHEGLGTRNRLVWLGDTYVELITADDTGLAAASWIGAPTLAALDRGGGLATLAIATDDVRAEVTRLRARGSGMPDPIDGERTRPDGAVVRWRLSAGALLGPDRPPFLIDHDPSSAEWTAADRAARAAGPGRVRVVEIAVGDVAAATRAALRALDLRFRPSLAGGGARDADIGPQVLRYRPRRDRSAPTATIHVSVAGHGPLDATLFGCRWIIDT